MTEPARVLLIGFGNPGRLDDGLGPALARRIAALHLLNVTVDSDYQLQLEDAEALQHHDVVIFADAAVSGVEPFFVERVIPSSDLTFSTHCLSPACVLGLSRDLFGAEPATFALGMRGYDWNEFGERLSARARHNLDEAYRFLRHVLGSTETAASTLQAVALRSHGTAPGSAEDGTQFLAG